jgi:two-component system, LuxR family, sensor kinase FixL
MKAVESTFFGGMSWVPVVWLFVASACVTLAAIHLVIGIRQPRAFHLWFALSALSCAAIAAFELALMNASTPARYGALLRWNHVPVFVFVAALVLFVQSFLNAGRPWLAAAAIAVRGVASLVVNFLRSPNLNYTEITGLRHVPFFGQMVSVAEGTPSRWTRLGELSSLLFLAFLADATRTVWRRGERRKAIVGGSAVLCVLYGSLSSALIHRGVLSTPYMISIPFFAVLLAMSYELTSDVLRAIDLSRRLDLSEEALRERDLQAALAARAANLGYWSWDVASGAFWMNDRAKEVRGLGAYERIDYERFLESVHPDDREEFRRSVRESLAEGGEFDRDYRVLRPDGEIRWIVSLGAIDRDESGRVTRVYGVSLDATKRKVAEIEAQRRESEFAHLSRVAIVGELSGSIAHELNQPLTAILSNAQAAQRFLSQDGGNLAELREILQDIVEEDKLAGEVIRRLRRLLRKGEVDLQRLDLAEASTDVLRLMRTDLIDRGVSLKTEIAGDLPQILADRVQIQQVLLNLLTNACDAMAGAEPQERRLLLRADRSDGSVHVSLADRGTGLPADEIERVFEPFVTTKSHGLGLGLTVCRTIISAHGGRLWATNNSDRGATFHFELPAADAP